MPNKSKLNLKNLDVKSFQTSENGTVKGGAFSRNCTQNMCVTFEIVNCTVPPTINERECI